MALRQREFDDGELERAQDQGRSARELLDQVGEKKRKKMIEGLREFEAATGIPEEEYIDKIEDCKSNAEIDEIERKTRKAATEWYVKQLKKSGLFSPMHDKEGAYLEKELNYLRNGFAEMPLTGEYSMISTLIHFKDELKPRQEIREKLKSNSKFIQNEFFRRIGSLGFLDRKEKLLEDIMQKLKGVEKAPSAVQHEFKKKQRSAAATKDTATLIEEVEKGYNSRCNKYKQAILSNLDYFGGEDVSSPYGKIPLTALEFIEWFEEEETFAKMDFDLRVLPTLINQRKRLYEERDEILKEALPVDRERLTKKTDLMRRHELEDFLPDLKEQIQGNNVLVAEYMATIIGAQAQGVNLFQRGEQKEAIRKIQTVSIESQKARLLILEEEIEDRARVVNEYFELEDYLRNDDVFLRASASEREKMLTKALNERNSEKESPFEISKEDDLDSEATEKIAKTLHSNEKIMDDIMEKIEQEGRLKAAKIQAETHDKIFGAAQRAKLHHENQKESYKRDLKYWIRLDENIKTENDVNTDKERNKLRFIQAADEAYENEEKVFTSSGEIDDLQVISAQNLRDGTGKVMEKLNLARYGEHVLVKNSSGEVAKDPLKMIENMSAQEMLRIMYYALEKLGGRDHLDLGQSNLTLLKNSPNIQKEMGHGIAKREFRQLKKAA